MGGKNGTRYKCIFSFFHLTAIHASGRILFLFFFFTPAKNCAKKRSQFLDNNANIKVFFLIHRAVKYILAQMSSISSLNVLFLLPDEIHFHITVLRKIRKIVRRFVYRYYRCTYIWTIKRRIKKQWKIRCNSIVLYYWSASCELIFTCDRINPNRNE